jgi:uncharacterized OB-fold protein
VAENAPAAPHSIADFYRGYEEGGKLRGMRCPACGHVSATWGIACARCGTYPLAEVELSPTGTVVAFTVQTVPGEEFLNDAPYAYVVVDLDGGGRVTGWMPAVRSESDLSIGDRVHFVPSYKLGVQFAKGPGTVESV